MSHRYSSDLDPPALLLPIHVRSYYSNGDGVETVGLLDTGADVSVIPEELCRQLGLLPWGTMCAGGLGEEIEDRPTFLIRVQFDDCPGSDLEVIASAKADYFLIGRDLLNDFILHADGPKKSFELTNP